MNAEGLKTLIYGLGCRTDLRHVRYIAQVY